MTSELVQIVDYNPEWPLLYEQEEALIRSALGKNLVDIQHIGSTAVSGLASKPIIDIMVGLKRPSLDEGKIAALLRIGYEFRGEAGIPGRLFFQKGKPRSRHLHIVKYGSEFYGRHILFRDYLRSCPEEARLYETLKRELARRYTSDRDAYTDGKAEFIKAVLERASAFKNN